MREQTVDRYMTKAPQCIDANERVVDAYKLMLKTNCRHLPVLKDGVLIGIVSQRGLYRLETLVNVDRAQDPVTDAMDEAYAVAPETSMIKVAAHMSRHKLGAAIVAHHGRVLGIFTTNDALDALVELLLLSPEPQEERMTPEAAAS